MLEFLKLFLRGEAMIFFSSEINSDRMQEVEFTIKFCQGPLLFTSIYHIYIIYNHIYHIYYIYHIN